MPERFKCDVLQKARYINTLTFTFTFISSGNTRTALLYNTVIEPIFTRLLVDHLTNSHVHKVDHCWLSS